MRPDDPVRRCRWRVLLAIGVIILIVSVSGWALRLLARDVRGEREAITAIAAAGGKVYYGWQRPDVSAFPPTTDPTWLGSFLARLGPDFIGQVVLVAFYADAKNQPDDSTMVHIARLRGLEQLDFCPPPADMFTFGAR